MSERYEVVSVGGGYSMLMDRQKGEPVVTGSGAAYQAPTENVQWTADMMNRTASVAPEAAPVAREEAPEPTPEPVRPNPAALLHVMAHSEPTDADGTPIDYDGTPIAPAPVVRPVEKVDYPRMAGKAIGSIGVLSGRLASIGRWLDALEDGSVSPEFAMRRLRQAQTEAHKYAEDIYEELSAR